MNNRRLLMIFARVPEHGKVKTRLAETIGEEKALQVYLELLQHTHAVASRLESVDKMLFYTSDPSGFDLLDYYRIPKSTQQGDSLGERMSDAFRRAFEMGYDEVIIIGSDCHALRTEHLEEGFQQLAAHDFVLGPAEDGGYYLLGMKKPAPWIFEEKTWSGPDVFLDTMLDIRQKEMSYHLLATLNDVDRESDLDEELRAAVGI